MLLGKKNSYLLFVATRKMLVRCCTLVNHFLSYGRASSNIFEPFRTTAHGPRKGAGVIGRISTDSFFFCFLLSLRTISPCYMHVRLWWNSWVQDCTFSRHMHMFELDAPVKLQNSLMYFPSTNSCALHHTDANVTGVVVRAPVFQQWKAKCLLVSVYTERIQQS